MINIWRECELEEGTNDNQEELTQRQPSYPAVPSILAIANASRPEKAPPEAADV